MIRFFRIERKNNRVSLNIKVHWDRKKEGREINKIGARNEKQKEEKVIEHNERLYYFKSYI